MDKFPYIETCLICVLFSLDLEMELFSKVVFGVTFIVALSSAILSTASPLKSPPSRLEILFKDGLVPRLANATQEVRCYVIDRAVFN